MRRSFDYAAFIRQWRELAAHEGLDPRTAQPVETQAVYRLDANGRRVLARVPVLPDPEPELLCDPSDPGWWKRPALFDDPGPAHSSTERTAIASIAAQARADVGAPRQESLAAAMNREFRAIVRDALAEDLPLRELHRRRGVEVIMLEGVRMEVPIKGVA